jgi:hypothetical protein
MHTEYPGRSERPVRWSAVIAGWLVAAGIAYIFYLAGLAIGFGVFDPANARAADEGIGIGASLWVLLTWITSLFLGGMFASWFDGSGNQTVGAMHGIAVWALAVTATAVMFALGVAPALQNGAGLIAGMPADVAEAHADAIAAALWVTLASVLLGMVAAAFGGWFGETHQQRLFGATPEHDRQREYDTQRDRYAAEPEPRMR